MKVLFEEMYLKKYDGTFHEILEYITQRIEKRKLGLKEIVQAHKENSRKIEEQRTHVDDEKLSMQR